MSIERVERATGTVWRVRWRDGAKARSRVIGTKKDAVAYDAEIRRRRRLGLMIEPDRGTETVAELYERWHLRHVQELAARTRASYEYMYRTHIDPKLGACQLRELTTLKLDDWKTDLRVSGVPSSVILQAMYTLSSMLTAAVRWNMIDSNPVHKIKKPSAKRERLVRPLTDQQIAKIIDSISPRYRPLVALMAYAGLRPSEALALTWDDITESRIIVEKAIAPDGKAKRTKNAKLRTVPVSDQLRAWLDIGTGKRRRIMRQSGDPWTQRTWNNWRNRVWIPLMKDLGLEGTRPYDLRHTYASRLIQEGLSVVEVARRMGHTPQITLSTYAHVFEEKPHEQG